MTVAVSVTAVPALTVLEETARVVVVGGWNAIKVALAAFGIFVIGLGVWGYHRAHTAEFRIECAAYQAHLVSMSFPDNLLCTAYG